MSDQKPFNIKPLTPLTGVNTESKEEVKQEEIAPETEKTVEQLLQEVPDRVKNAITEDVTRKVLEALKKTESSSVGTEKDRMMMEVLERIASMQNENLKSQKDIIALNKKKVFGIRSIDQSEIDFDDVLKDPIIFFAWGFSTVIADDYVNGLTVQPPYGRAISFRHLYRMQTPNGKFSSYSFCMVYSKKQADFLRNHSDFNVRIFESLNAASSVENEYMTHVIAANDKLKKMDGHALIMLARNKGVANTSMDLSQLKTALMKVMVEESMTDINGRNQRTIEQHMYEDTSGVH